MNPYVKFGVMIGVSTFLMYWLMYLNVFQLDHVFFSQTRLYMALIMGSVMAFVMLLFMWGMYKNKKLNAIILGTSALVFGLSLWLVRSQTTVDDVSWMKAMIPHHSIAILTSERAEIEDPRVKQLSEEIINAQEREIAEMKRLIEELEKEEEQAKTDMQVHAKTDRSE
ncbi:DUF305 domain-containing protein [Exiguobacterium alkaliphilum]|uniref:DUF305 domain-containing protein n=1 Tax=Exiguobacterium alkaliphilum TaxID=1428684 RepID=A0ABT2KZL5_9BACL|nr:DUF305 domain-containing protein [Exiguobacterium alkaliphilum]MCT4796043.1 DUF305 domain-containing protein [Exiguobacterium alkaliphilum]QUE87122.1 DUF305 domain-containing protein [Exiguobacterium alkaliphilum]